MTKHHVTSGYKNACALVTLHMVTGIPVWALNTWAINIGARKTDKGGTVVAKFIDFYNAGCFDIGNTRVHYVPLHIKKTLTQLVNDRFFQRGTFILQQRAHWLTMKDGVFYDSRKKGQKAKTQLVFKIIKVETIQSEL